MDDIKHSDSHQTVEVEAIPMTAHEMEAEIKKINAIHSANVDFLVANHTKQVKLAGERVGDAIMLAGKAIELCASINEELKDCRQCCEH